MVLGAFVFPPIDELFVWPDIVFEDTFYAINKTSLLVMVSTVLILAIFVGGSRNMKLVPSKFQNVLESTYEFVDRGITQDVIGHDAGRFTPFLGSLFLFILFLNFWEIIPFIQFPPTVALRHPAVPRAHGLRPVLVTWASSTRASSTSPATSSRPACRWPSTSS